MQHFKQRMTEALRQAVLRASRCAGVCLFVLVLTVGVEQGLAGQRLAVGIGIDEYGPSQSLNHAVRDAEAFGNLMKQRGYDEVTVLLNRDASRDNVMRTVSEVLRKANQSDTIVFFFAGHGRRVKGQGGSLESYMIPYGCGVGEELQSGISIPEFSAWMSGKTSAQVVMLVDACHAGGDVSSPSLVRKELPGSVFMLTATRQSEVAFEDGGHGVFTQAVLAAMRPQESISSKMLSCSLLAANVQQRVRSETGGWQNPVAMRIGNRAETVAL